MELHCRLHLLGDKPVLEVSGELDLATLPHLRDQLFKAIDQHQGTTLYVDLDGITALDDTGLGMLLGGAGRARQQGGDILLVCTSEHLRGRFALTGLDRAIEVRQTRG